MLQIIAWHDATADLHQQKFTQAIAQGYRTLSLSLYGNSTATLRHACVMVKRPVVIAEQMVTGLSADGYQKAFNDMAAKGMGPHIVTATGPANAAIFGAVFVQASPIPLTRHGLSPQDFATMNQQATANGQKLVWFDCYGTPGDERYIATWWPDPELLAWNCDGIGEDGPTMQQRFDGISKTWAYLAQSVMTPSGRGTSLYYDGNIGAFESRFGLTSAQYQTLFNEQTAKGLVPLRVCGKGEGANARFCAMFATQERPVPRVFTPSGVTPPNTAVDTIFKEFMKAHGIRSGSVAVVADQRLVYTQGYTWAEPGFPAVQPTTLFRQASCSKIFVAYALYALMQTRRDALPKAQETTLRQMLASTTLQSVLNLTAPGGAAPADPRFAQVSLLALLESISGINQGFLFSSTDAAKAAGKPLPATRLQLAQYIAGQMLLHQPGDPANNVYGNTDYFLLSEAVRAMARTDTFEGALQQLICGPLGMAHVRGSRSLLADQPGDEARYALSQPPPSNESAGELSCGYSLRTPTSTVVPTQYGAWDMEMYSGCGGLSVAVVDMARLIASLSARDAHPVLQADTIDQWMKNATDATANITCPAGWQYKHGFHGWDWVNTPSAEKHIYAGAKGGSIPGTGTQVIFTTGGYSYIAFFADQGRDGVKADWAAPLAALAPPADWATTDLFPNYNMKSFQAPAMPKGLFTTPPQVDKLMDVHLSPPVLKAGVHL